MKKLVSILGMLAIAIVALAALSCGSPYKYETVPGDPMGSRIYTLDNGLKVYMAVNKETPRIQTYIAVRRRWKAGDQITLELPMEVRMERIPDGKDYVAFIYGFWFFFLSKSTVITLVHSGMAILQLNCAREGVIQKKTIMCNHQ